MKHTFEVNASGIKRVLEDMFTSTETFLKELCQNAERAGATWIEIDWDEVNRMLTVQDNGRGFSKEGWDSFFTVGSSAWGEEVTKEQNPFGIGCASCLYAADWLKILSLDKGVSFETDKFLSGGEVEVKDRGGYIDGAYFCLKIKEKIDVPQLLKSLPRVFKYFPVPVSVNGIAIERPLALDSELEFIDTDFGKLWVSPEILEGSKSLDYTDKVLQGYLVSYDRRHGEPTVVVHLYPSKYRARVPDRDCLVDAEGIDTLIHRRVLYVLVERLRTLYDSMSVSEFALNYWEKAMRFAPELLRDSPFPRRLLREFTSLPQPDGSGEIYGSGLVYMEELDHDLIQFSGSLSENYTYYSDEYNTANLAFISGSTICDASDFPDGHWALDHIRDDLEVEIETHGKTEEFLLTCGEYSETIIMCESYSIFTEGSEEVSAISGSSDYEALCYDNIIYIPSKCRNYWEALRQQVTEYGDYGEQTYEEAIEVALAKAVVEKRDHNLNTILADCLEGSDDVGIFSSDLEGKSFTVTFGKLGRVTVVEVED